MKQAAKLLRVAAVAVSISFLVSTIWADNTHVLRTGHPGSSGSVRDFHSGYRGGYYSGFRHRYWDRGGWYPWNFSFSYAYAPSPYYYYDGYYYYDCYYDPPTVYYPPPVVYGSQPTEAYNSSPPAPVAESSPQPVADRPLSPTAVDRDSTPPSPRPPRPPQIQQSDQGQSLGVADVKALVKAGLSEEVILSQIRNSHTVYHLTTAEIIDLKENGVSENMLDFMINTASP